MLGFESMDLTGGNHALSTDACSIVLMIAEIEISSMISVVRTRYGF